MSLALRRLDSRILVAAIDNLVQGELIIAIGQENLPHPVFLVRGEVAPAARRHRNPRVVPFALESVPGPERPRAAFPGPFAPGGPFSTGIHIRHKITRSARGVHPAEVDEEGTVRGENALAAGTMEIQPAHQ